VLSLANRTIRTPEKEQALIAALHAHPSKTRACRSARVGRVAFYAWLKDDPDFKSRVEAAQEIGVDAVEDALLSDAINHDTTAAIFALKSWRPARYQDKTQHDHRHQHKHRHYDLSGFTPEQEAQLDELAASVESGRITP
jgi:hypothetical protein